MEKMFEKERVRTFLLSAMTAGSWFHFCFSGKGRRNGYMATSYSEE